MSAVWLAAAIQPSLQVIPAQVPAIDEDIPDGSSAQTFPSHTLIKSLTLRACERSKVIFLFFNTTFWDDDTEAKRGTVGHSLLFPG